MSAVIYTFSGTGNTMHAARKTAACINAEIKYVVHEFNEGNFVCTAEDVHIIFPVYYWGPPVLFKKFLEKLELPNAKYITLLVTAGSSVGVSYAVVDEILRKKGKKLDMAQRVIMPSNYIPFMTVKDAKDVQKSLAISEKKIDRYIEAIKNRAENSPFKASFLAKFFFKIFHDRNAKKDKKFYLTPGCTKCAVCARVCPANDITIEENGPVWHHKCLQCLACINYCPERVIQMKHARSQHQGRYHHPLISASDIEEQK